MKMLFKRYGLATSDIWDIGSWNPNEAITALIWSDSYWLVNDVPKGGIAHAISV